MAILYEQQQLHDVHNREYAMLRLADENVAKKSRIMMLLISA